MTFKRTIIRDFMRSYSPVFLLSVFVFLIFLIVQFEFNACQSRFRLSVETRKNQKTAMRKKMVRCRQMLMCFAISSRSRDFGANLSYRKEFFIALKQER